MRSKLELAPEYRGCLVDGEPVPYDKVVFDLDKTILFIGNSSCASDENMVLMDTFGSGRQCFLPRADYENLKYLLKKYQTRLVINTARDYYQVERLGVFREAPLPKYVICANGSELYIDGQHQDDHSAFVQGVLAHKFVPTWEELIRENPGIKGCLGRERPSIKVLEGREFRREYLKLLTPEMLAVSDIVSEGRKLMVSSKQINKMTALTHLVLQHGLFRYLYAGDSILDLPCMELAVKSLVPWGSIIAESYPLRQDITYTTHAGVQAAGEIIKQMLDFLREGDK